MSKTVFFYGGADDMKVPSILFPKEYRTTNSKNEALLYSRMYARTRSPLFALRALTLAIEYSHMPEPNIRDWWLSGAVEFSVTGSLDKSLRLKKAYGRGSLLSQQQNAERAESIIINLACLMELGFDNTTARTLLYWRDHTSLLRVSFKNTCAELNAEITEFEQDTSAFLDFLLPEREDVIRYLKTFENSVMPEMTKSHLTSLIAKHESTPW